MVVVDARRVTDQFEWASLARLAPSFTHEWSWATQCAERLNVLAFSKINLRPVYLRAWNGDYMYGCPFITFDDTRIMNVPLSAPMLLSEAWPLPDRLATEVIADAWPDAELHDHSAHWTIIHNALRRLNDRTTKSSRAWGLSPTDRDMIAERGRWDSTWDRDHWLHSFARLWRGPWRTELVTHRNDDDIIGWSCHIHRDGYQPELAAVVTVGRLVEPWMSPRLRQSST